MPSLIFKDAEQARDSICIEDQRKIRDLYAEWADKVAERAEFYEKKTTASSYWQQQQMLELERQLRSQSMQIHKEIESGSKSSMYMIADSVVGCNAEFLKSLGFKEEGINAAFTSIPNRVVSNIVTGQIYESGWSLSKAIWTDNQKTLSDIYSIVAQGRAMNMSAYEVSKMLERYVSPSRKMQWNLKMNDGVKIYKKTVDYNAQRLVRTLNQHAYQQSVIQVVKDNPFIPGIYWRANGSRVCPLCMDRDGNFYKWNELPMDHPNGMCTMEPATDMDKTVDQLADWIKEPDGTYPEIDELAKKFGYEPTPAVINAGLSPEELKQKEMFDKLPDGVKNIIGKPGAPLDIDYIRKNTNPNFHDPSYKYPLYHENCQRCVVAYELQRRGYDVEVLSFDGRYPSIFNLFRYENASDYDKYTINGYNGERSGQYKINRSPKTTSNTIKSKMLEWGDGSRATLQVDWKGTTSSHIINVENVKGEIWIIDSQCGRKTKDIERYMGETKCANAELVRTDNMIFKDDFKKTSRIDDIERISTIVKQRGK